MSAQTCLRRFCGTLLIEQLDPLGRVILICPACARNARGVCRDCPARLDQPRAMRCATCRIRRHAEQSADWERIPENRERKNANYRRRYRHRTPEQRARRAAQRRAWRNAHADRVKAHKRRAALNPTPRRREREQWWNAQPERQEKKRAQALKRYYELHPVRPDPRCKVCGVPLEWTPGHGRPRQTCDDHCTPAELRRRQRGDNRRAGGAERAVA